MTQRMFLVRSLTFSFQRLFSPASPLTSFSAAVSLARQALALASTSSFWVTALSSSRLSTATFSLSVRTRSLTFSSSFFLASRSASARSFYSTSGLTFLKMAL